MRRVGAPFLVVLVAAALVPRAAASPANVVTIERDAYGVPHIAAPSQTSLAYAMGFSLAEDRPFQLDLFRRAGEGRLSEILGEGSDDDSSGRGDYLEADIITRREFWDQARMQAQIDGWDPRLRDLWQAYGNGINAGWAETLANPATHPVEFGALAAEPAPWTTLDSLAVTTLFTIVDNGAWGGDGEFENAALLKRLRDRYGNDDADTIWHDALWMNDPDTSTVIPDGVAPPKPSGVGDAPTHPDESQAGLALPPPTSPLGDDALLIKSVVSKLALPKLGSYAVAIAPKNTKSGHAMFLGAPQSGVSAPPVMWEVGLQAPGIDCGGGAVPGAGPFLILGRCKTHAWSVVSGNAGDTVDDVVEDRSGTSDYMVGTTTTPIEERTEHFLVRSTDVSSFGAPQVDEIDKTFMRTRHGPVFASDADHLWVRQRAQDSHEIENLTSLFDLTTAQSLTEANAAVKEGSWSVHITYADSGGHIAYWFTGRNPVRAAGMDPRLPTPGAATLPDWNGKFIPKDQNPHVVDPPEGFLVANQGEDTKPVSWWPNADDWRMGRVERRRTTESFVRGALARGKIDDAALKQVNKLACCDTDPLVPYLVDAAREAVELHPTPERVQAIDLLDSWAASGFARRDQNGDGRYDDPGLTIWAADDMPRDVYHGTLPPGPVWEALFNGVFPSISPNFGYYGVQDRLQILDRALRQARGRPTGLHLSRDYFDGMWDEHMVAAIDSGLNTLRSELGSDMSQWLWNVNTIPVTAYGALSVDDLDVSDHSSYNFLVDFASSSDFQSVLAPGEGSPVSLPAFADFTVNGTYPPHYVDQRELYEHFEFKTMTLSIDPSGSVRTLVFPQALKNSPPHATDDSATTDASKPVTIAVLANDYDPDGDAMTVSSVGRPQYGSVSVDPSGVVTYSPQKGYSGPDSFTYTVRDAGGATSTGNVSVTVNRVPATLRVTLAGNGSGVVRSEPAGVDCPDDCREVYDSGTVVTLRATAAVGSSFAGWGGACSGGAGECRLTLTEDAHATVRFMRVRLSD